MLLIKSIVCRFVVVFVVVEMVVEVSSLRRLHGQFHVNFMGTLPSQPFFYTNKVSPNFNQHQRPKFL